MKLMKFKRVAVTVLIVLAAYLLQCTLFNHLELAGIKPNLILIVTASFGFMRGQKEGMLVGFFAGLITDIQFGTILGFYALLYLVIGFVNGLFEQLYFDEDIKLSTSEADSIYAGILIDTNNFMTKTGVRTFEAAAYLRRCGAEVTRVRKMLRNDMNAYKARAEAVRHAQVYKGCFAISVCPADDIESPTVACAQAANELLNIIGIRASFVLTEYQGKIYISARSIDEINVQRIMEHLGGGGHMNTAGAQLTNSTVEEALATIKATLDEMIKEGDIE